eukprot:TRINITY_DN1321_c2_g1_i1.p1 TRINITY_DN1321_c2_g1~~TRINITY_DN1321_c2_g1_i1.p1  ORF type:complete len:658 (+),score=81.08 TRINITY_DN1321_c2_g1_i1:47-1975(+)
MTRAQTGLLCLITLVCVYSTVKQHFTKRSSSPMEPARPQERLITRHIPPPPATPPPPTIAPCLKSREIYPGKMLETGNTMRWDPDICFLEELKSTCLEGKKIAFIGDSGVRGLAQALLPYAEHHHMTVGSAMQLPSASPLHVSRIEHFKEYNLVVYGTGHEDRNQVPIDQFQKVTDDTVGKLKKIVGTEKLVVNILHHVNSSVCETAARDRHCHKCSEPIKAKAYRDALKSAAARHGVPVLDFEELTRKTLEQTWTGPVPMGQVHKVTNDGQTYHDIVAGMEAQIVLNNVCGNLAFEPLPSNDYKTPSNSENIKLINAKCGAVETIERNSPVPSQHLLPNPDLKKICSSQNELFPGTVQSPSGAYRTWVAEGCHLPEMAEIDLEKCLEGKKIMFFGDSLTRQVAEAIQAEGRHIEFAPNDNGQTFETQNGYFKFMTAPALSLKYFPSYNIMHQSRLGFAATADYIIYGTGMWDMGKNNYRTPLDKFVDRMINITRTLRDIAEARGKKFALNPMHHVNQSICYTPDKNRLCFKCLNPVRAAAYRQAVIIAAACNNVPVFNFEPMTRDALAQTWSGPVALGGRHATTADGSHYTSPVNRMLADVVVNWVCRDDFVLTQPTECNPEQAKKLWDTQPETKGECYGT